MANQWWPKSDCLTTWTTTRIQKILLLHLWMGQQSSVSTFLKKELALQKISGTRNHQCGKSTTVELSKILLPSMHLNLGLMKNFVKSMNQEEVAFTYLWEMFPRLSKAKLKEGVFIGPQILDLIKDEYFDTLLQGDEKTACDSFKFVVKGFLENSRAQNYGDLVNNLLQSYQNLGCNVSEKYTSFTRICIFPWQLWCSEWWTRRTFRSTHFFNGEEILRKMELCCARRLLLDFGKWCP